MKELENALRRGAAASSDEATRRFAERAASEGLVDVAYTSVDSPLGPLTVAVTPRGLVRVAYTLNEDPSSVLEQLATRVSPRVLEAPARLDDVRRELDQYFAGRRHEFSVPLDWTLTRGFTRKLLRATARIPFGEVLTYTQVATKAGSPRGSRAAGNALGSNPMPIVVPCHRVIAAGSKLGGYTGGIERKEFLLGLEGALPQLRLPGA